MIFEIQINDFNLEINDSTVRARGKGQEKKWHHLFADAVCISCCVASAAFCSSIRDVLELPAIVGLQPHGRGNHREDVEQCPRHRPDGLGGEGAQKAYLGAVVPVAEDVLPVAVGLAGHVDKVYLAESAKPWCQYRHMTCGVGHAGGRVSGESICMHAGQMQQSG